MSRLTHEQFLKRLWEKNEHYRRGEFEVSGEYLYSKTKIHIKDMYGSMITFPEQLLRGSKPSISLAIDRTAYFRKQLEYKNMCYKQGGFIVLGTYTNAVTKLLLKDSYGLVMMEPIKLLRGAVTTITSAVDKTKYWLNMAKESHGDFYDYSEVVYESAKKKVYIKCPTHGVFKQSPCYHQVGSGCPTCAKELNVYKVEDWIKMCPGNPGIFYILRCFNEEEEFYKVGITCKTSVRRRYSGSVDMPYNYEVIKEVKDFDRSKIWSMEKDYIKNNREHHYIPKIRFGGSAQECFTKNNMYAKK